MALNLDLYQTFFAIAQNGSISKAAEQLYITQPAVSRALRQLEDEMRCSLFLRTPKGVKLTQEGEVLYRYLEQAFSFLATARKRIDAIQNLQSGEIRIGVSDTLCKHFLLPYLKLFNTLHPKIRIHVICPNTPGIVALLKAGKIDFGLINLPYGDPELSFSAVMEIQDCFVTGEKYRYLSRKVQPLLEILKLPLLMLDRNSHSRILMDQYFESCGVRVSPDFELDNMDLLVSFARFDLGVACVIRQFVEEELQAGKLYEVKPIEKIPPRSIGVAWHGDIPLSSASKELISMLKYNETTDI